MDLIPPALVVARYFADEQSKVDTLHTAAEEASRAVEEYIEEHAVEDGLLAEAMDDDKISKPLAATRFKVARHEGAEAEEIKALQHLIKLYNEEAVAKKAAKEAQAALDLATLKKYGNLAESEVKQLVLDDKWHATVNSRVVSEAEVLTLRLVTRIQQLGERYAETVGEIESRIMQLDRQVGAHLKAMGVM
jgi:type I restriction enzyme M protein